MASTTDGALRELGHGSLETGWSQKSKSVFMSSGWDIKDANKLPKLYVMPLAGGEMTLVSESLISGDSMMVSGEIAVYRQSIQSRKIWSLLSRSGRAY